MKIVITGANGFLGQYLVRDLLQRGHTVFAIGRGASRMALQHPRLSYLASVFPNADGFPDWDEAIGHADMLIHAAALTQVDYCEEHQEEAYQTNVIGTQQVADWAQRSCRHLMFISTDFVFDGLKGNYVETDPAAPVNYYGTTKLKGEEIVRSTPMPWTIIRTCLVYGHPLTGTRSNLIAWVKENLEKGQSIKVVADQLRTPTFVEDLSQGIILAAEKKASGMYHISGREIFTPYEMALQVAAYFALNHALIEKVDATTFSQKGVRPLKTGFTITKAVRELGFNPRSVQAALRRMYGAQQ